MSRQALPRRIGILLAALGLVAAGTWAAGQRPPAEVQTLEAILTRLSRGNDLGRQPISFMVGSGTYTARLAQQLGACKNDECELFAQLNPYKQYNSNWNEMMRQGHALGDIEAWSTSSGTIVIPRATFRAYGPHIGYLACTVAHEMSHIFRHHIFQQSYHVAHNLGTRDEEAKQAAGLQRSRELELEADRDAATMLARSGYRGRICLEDLKFMFRSIGDGSATQPDSTHPGYEERIAAMSAHYDTLEKQPPKALADTRFSLHYERSDNLLIFRPATATP